MATINTFTRPEPSLKKSLARAATGVSIQHDSISRQIVLFFFCVLIRRNLYEELQGLDEDFGLGYYEDTDFVYRAIKAGKQMVISEKTFVYHKGKGSFSKVNGAVRKLMKKNKKLFRKNMATAKLLTTGELKTSRP